MLHLFGGYMMMRVKGMFWWIMRWVLWLGALVFFLYMGSRWHYAWFHYLIVIAAAYPVGCFLYYW